LLNKQHAAELETDLQQYETQYQSPSPEFYQKFRPGELKDDIDFCEWSSFYQMSCSVRERLQIGRVISRFKAKLRQGFDIMSGRLTVIKLLPPATNRNESNH